LKKSRQPTVDRKKKLQREAVEEAGAKEPSRRPKKKKEELILLLSASNNNIESPLATFELVYCNLTREPSRFNCERKHRLKEPEQ
jgi:hypothetical protein